MPESPDLLQAMADAVVAGDADRARELARGQVDRGGDLLLAIERGFSAGIRRVGELWEAGDYFLPELVQGAEAMKSAMSELLPALARTRGGFEPRGRVVLGTVRGDLHDIGKSLVGVLLSAHGFEVHDLGVDVPVEAFVARAREVGADIVGASALLTTTMVAQRELVTAVNAAGFGRPPRVLVGGAPTSPRWAAEIGAVHAENAMRAVTVAESLLG
jgi:trimethylamine corrinoid protein